MSVTQPTRSVRSRGKWMWIVLLLCLSVGAAGVSVYRFCRQEGSRIADDIARADTERSWREVWAAMKSLQRHGADVGFWEWKFDQWEGLYVNLSHWHGTKSDLPLLEKLWFYKSGHFFLSLKGLSFNDDDIQHLEPLTSLEYLDLTDTQVSDAGVGRLQRVLPKITVIRDAATWEKLVQSPLTSWLGKRPWTADLPIDPGR